MPDQTYAAWLRGMARRARLSYDQAVVGTTSTSELAQLISPDEADAIADALEAADEAPCACAPSWMGLGDRCRFHQALAALDRRAGREEGEDEVRRLLDAPPDDEPYTEEEQAEDEAALKRIEKGEGIDLDELIPREPEREEG